LFVCDDSEALAHMLYAAADIVLVPSIFEPCGLTQMIGMRYGAIPLVRRTGGLADTVFDVDDQSKQDCANGFVFNGLDEGSLSSTLERAMSYYQQRPDWWLELTSKAMELDNSWDKSAGEYLSLYQSVRVR
jgi:starch synthase